MTFVDGSLALSMIVTVATAGAPRVTPEGLRKLTLKVSFPSTNESSLMSTTKLLEVSLEAKRSVPIAVM